MAARFVLCALAAVSALGSTVIAPPPVLASTVPNPCAADNLSPSSRMLVPVAVKQTSGDVGDPPGVLSGRATQLTGKNASVTLDFGKEVGGVITVHFPAASDSSQSLGLAFTESPQFIGETSDASNGGSGPDGALTAAVATPGSYTVPSDKQRGGFRYLTLFLQSDGWAQVDAVSLAFTAAPGNPRPDNYPNYFCSNDDLLNRIWYAGAYTVQLNTVDPKQGRVWGPPSQGWENNGQIGVGASVLVDGAKRDRTVWPGDMGIAVPTDFDSIGDMAAVRNSLTTLYEHQDAAGALPMAGPEVNFPGEMSDTYHMWSLVGTATYFLDTADRPWLDGIWSQYKRAVAYALAKTDPSGLMFVTGPFDWYPAKVGETVEANAILYDVLTSGAQLATVEGDSVTATVYSTKALELRTAINTLLWDPLKGAYRDNGDTTGSSSTPTYPQDGNSLAVWFGVVDTPAKARSVLSYLRSNWNTYGAATPEFNGGDHPFPGSMEVRAHFAAGDDINGLALIRKEWGYMLSSPIGTGSTFWEGYRADGSLAYDAGYSGAPKGTYTSLAHGWATGPTSALTNDVLGVAPDSAGGATYRVIPHPGDLAHAEGRLTMPVGAVDASWNHALGVGFALTVGAPDVGQATATVAVPRDGAGRVVTVNGVEAWDGGRFLGAPGIASADQDESYIYFRGVPAGVRTFAWGAGPSTTLPESPWVPVLPLLGTGALLVLVWRRRRRSRSVASLPASL